MYRQTEYRIWEHAKIKSGANNVVYERIKVIPNVNIDKYTSDSVIKLTIRLPTDGADSWVQKGGSCTGYRRDESEVQMA